MAFMAQQSKQQSRVPCPVYVSCFDDMSPITSVKTLIQSDLTVIPYFFNDGICLTIRTNFLLTYSIITYPLGGGYVLFSPLFLTALSLSLSLSLIPPGISYLLLGITRPLLERE